VKKPSGLSLKLSGSRSRRSIVSVKLSEIMLSTFFGICSLSDGLACITLPNQVASVSLNPSILFHSVSNIPNLTK
jgi:hypothetical protein